MITDQIHWGQVPELPIQVRKSHYHYCLFRLLSPRLPSWRWGEALRSAAAEAHPQLGPPTGIAVQTQNRTLRGLSGRWDRVLQWAGRLDGDRLGASRDQEIAAADRSSGTQPQGPAPITCNQQKVGFPSGLYPPGIGWFGLDVVDAPAADADQRDAVHRQMTSVAALQRVVPDVPNRGQQFTPMVTPALAAVCSHPN